ncbi:MAG: hypothetical protein WA477_14575 [Candidatus Sulfotelmatobacter sp.]
MQGVIQRPLFGKLVALPTQFLFSLEDQLFSVPDAVADLPAIWFEEG